MSHHTRSRGALGVLAALALATGAVVLASPGSPAAAEVREHTITGFWQNFDNGAEVLRLADIPDAYGIVAVAFAESVPSTPGAIDFALDPDVSAQLDYDEADFTADVARLQAEGRRVVISVGGEKGSITLPDQSAADAFASSTLALMDEYGFDGVDIDLENAPNLQYMTSALRQISAAAGDDLVLTMAPETIYVQPGGSYLQLIDEVSDIITVVNTQYYNSGSMLGRDGKAYSAGTVDFQTALADILLDGHLRPDQVGLGLPATSRAAGSGYVDPEVVGDALDCLAAGVRCGSYTPASTYPAIRGAMTWSVNWDATNGYDFAETVGARLQTLGEGGSPDPDPTEDPDPAGCEGTSAWSSGAVYTGGSEASHDGALWRARWWTQGETPGGADVWERLGDC
ncbi:glycosyl hydrolase family 18 protein [Homoserinibacter sp. YIM 151385]|uniref:glycosyl hydrolase family 18 protein n=1 Tax=Homoserinibacter sp. YIM 151385 TaxID=2985506 RepID=UPI0022F09AD1|nr:glycosyl hydrolase family 18 protein [Homoserinibacter sp. YIM 151385]WBU38457.1 glycosyl hydrolase family 18 protein [Homoserinibacter sp. YIM 151385]